MIERIAFVPELNSTMFGFFQNVLETDGRSPCQESDSKIHFGMKIENDLLPVYKEYEQIEGGVEITKHYDCENLKKAHEEYGHISEMQT